MATTTDPTAATRLPADVLHAFARDVFVARGVPDDDAATAADVLVTSDLRAVESHGVPRLASYVNGLEDGRVNPTPRVTIVRETACTATVDGDGGLGLVVGPRANEIAMAKAEDVGTGWVVVRNSNHYGIAGYYPLQAVERGLIGWSMTNSSANQAPLWGAEARLGSNAIAIGFPGGEEGPVVVDMASSVVSHGKLEIAARAGASIPLGWAIDADGQPTSDPGAVRAGGALLPLGGTKEQGGHKGYALASVVDIFTGVLSGAAWGPFTPRFTRSPEPPSERSGVGIGHLFAAMRVDAFADPDEFRVDLDEWIRTLRATRPLEGAPAVLVPGDPERAAEADRRAHGIPLSAPVVASLREVAERTGVPLEV